MKRKLISHELPLSLMKKNHDRFNDYMFVLLHKLIEDKEYYKTAKEYTGILYLDNSCFELGESLSNELLFEYYDKLQPDYVLLPDVLGKRGSTIKRTFEFMTVYPQVLEHAMPVAQGSTPMTFIDCYKLFSNSKIYDFNIIGIPFCFPWIEKNNPQAQADERIRLLKYMADQKIINTTKKHHLLGTWQAREFMEYRDYKWIHSIDTSNPVMAALDGDKYTTEGLLTKPKMTFDKAYDLKIKDLDVNLIQSNVQIFRGLVNG